MTNDMKQQRTNRNHFFVNLNALNDIKNALQIAPPPPKILSAKECLIELIPELKEARARGHTADSLREILAGIGLKVSTRNVTDALRSGDTVRKPYRETQRKPAQKSKAAAFRETMQAATAGVETGDDGYASECYDSNENCT